MTTLNKPQEQYSSIPNEVVQASKRAFDKNPVIKFLTKEFGEKSIAHIIKGDDVGTAKNGALFWFKDQYGKFTTAKIVQVDERSGCILSEGEELIHERFSKIHNLGFNYKPCFFREYLFSSLDFGFRPKGIVHGELLALVLSVLVPGVGWLSAQNDNEFNPKIIAGVLPEVSVFLFPRSDSFDTWKEAVKDLDPNYIKVSNHFYSLYRLHNNLDLRKDTPHMREAVEYIQSLIRQADEYYKKISYS